MEAVGAIGAIILLLILCSSSNNKPAQRYRIEQTQDSRYFEVIDRNGEAQHIGTYESCEIWINEHSA